MNVTELDHALRELRLSGMGDSLDTRLRHAQAERLPPLGFIAVLVSDELQRRQDRLLERRRAQARFRDPTRSLDTFDFTFNKKLNRALVFELTTCRFITQREDCSLIGPPRTGKSHLAQALGQAAIQQGHRVLYRGAHVLLEELTDATLDGTRMAMIADLSAVPLLIIDDLGMRKLPATAAEDLLEVIMRRYELASTILTSNRRVDDWGEAARRHRGRDRPPRPAAPPRARLTCGPRSWRTKLQPAADPSAASAR
jgi:DNA replication protein DnaC